MRKYNYVLWIVIGLLLASIFYILFFNTGREDKMIKRGNDVVKKIEIFKAENKRLPNTLDEVGIPEKDGGYDVIYYYKRDSLHYTVSFPISAEEHKFYYSDSKQWEKGYREIK